LALACRPFVSTKSLMWFSELRLNIHFEHCRVHTCSTIESWRIAPWGGKPIKLSIVWALDTSSSTPRHQIPKNLFWANPSLRFRVKGAIAFVGQIWCWVIALAGKFFCYNPNVAMSSRLIDPVSDWQWKSPGIKWNVKLKGLS
jgi:hypothetical protein